MPRISIKRFRAVVALLASLASGTAANAAVLPLPETLGLTNGEQYQFVFVTNSTTFGSSASLSTYNNFVQTAANNASIGTSVGLTWKAIVSVGSGSSNAASNAPASATVKVYRIDGVQVANGGTNPFYSGSANHLAAINVTELGTTVNRNVWTGGNANGSESGSGLLGTAANPIYGYSGGTLAANGDPNSWSRIGNIDSGNPYSLYALSGVLTAPEPSSLMVAGLMLTALAGRRRRRTEVAK
ncbi:PEP-CTERM sorting domain-containing protein [Humisphaera borealis]|uniref:PEP-CTERM sorting domain-containing protein n=1 Tax=Humisphaera borealis TaxID=2807512 RepID=A0A7M2X3D1_9BACT|nr:PEP-CTERM sorting domain-containing protein [Humisphaera borealis]QOV92184.1 PEP-CTERM sorting domain-containing protein [Humisphaera borealis]